MNLTKLIILYSLIFTCVTTLEAMDLYKSVQEVVHREVPTQDVDNDGVLDYLDDCPDSFIDTKVNKIGCPLSSLIVLLPNHKSQNAIVVENEMGTMDVDQPYTYVRINVDDEPMEPKKISKSELDKMFPFMSKNRYKRARHYTLHFINLEINQASKLRLERVFKDIKSRTNPIITIVGFTDTVGSLQNNKILGQKRAQKIATMIDAQALQYMQMHLKSQGEKNLYIDTKDEVSEPRNRRVEIFIK